MAPNASSAQIKPTKISKTPAKKRSRSLSPSSGSEALSDVASPIPHPHNNSLKQVDDASSNVSPSTRATRKRRHVSVLTSNVGLQHHVYPLNVSRNNPLEQNDDASSMSPPLAAPTRKQRCVSSSSEDVVELCSEDSTPSQQAEPDEQVRNLTSHVRMFNRF